MLKVLAVFGTRPEAIKMAPVIQQLKKKSSLVQSLVCVTGQHRQMLDQVLKLFEIQPDYDLDIMEEGQSLGQVTTNVLTRMEVLIAKEKPDWVLVQGDTTTAMASALAAFYHSTNVGHIEAGLRTRNKFHPFPEEINRKIIDSLCDLHFAPTPTARQNLLREGIDNTSISVTGNTVIDALQWVATLPFDSKMMKDNGIRIAESASTKLVLVTAHRRENFGEPLSNICSALRIIAEKYRDQVQIVYPVHLNPNVQEPVYRLLNGIPNIILVPPLEYLSMVHLMKYSYLVITDSGGIQEEAPGLGKPVLVLREVTERPEAVEAGTVKVIGTDQQRIVDETVRLFEDRKEYEKMARAVNPYGDGHAAEYVAKALFDYIAAKK